ncbi:bacterio-opsin activator domain-containing protein [Natrinema gelatinilyticum]|uniref:bacterio-opsin activator domain-containing protein n=1 Tax=Natrinema gelatinilyticum TaxID=2961571 RepID=UPI0020C27531|nr:bacterio-opsin activator domain-containing protein [Natrinema gelatinilyticum]
MASSEETTPDDSIVEVEFKVSDRRYPLVALSAETGCDAELLQILPRSDGAYTVFHRISSASSEQILEFASKYDGFRARVVSSGEKNLIVEFRIHGDGEFFIISLTDAGAIPTQLGSTNGVAHIAAEIPPIYSASDVISHFRERYPSMEILARRKKKYSASLFQRREFYNTIVRELTPRQHEVVLLAYTNGYYDWPREQTGEELAAELGVSYSTFSEHLRKAEQKILSKVFGIE